MYGNISLYSQYFSLGGGSNQNSEYQNFFIYTSKETTLKPSFIMILYLN